MTYIAMNRFRIVKGLESNSRYLEITQYLLESNQASLASICLKDLRMKIMFFMLPTESEPHFIEWTGQTFRKAHAGAGSRGHLYRGTGIRGFQVVEETSVFANEN